MVGNFYHLRLQRKLLIDVLITFEHTSACFAHAFCSVDKAPPHSPHPLPILKIERTSLSTALQQPKHATPSHHTTPAPRSTPHSSNPIRHPSLIHRSHIPSFSLSLSLSLPNPTHPPNLLRALLPPPQPSQPLQHMPPSPNHDAFDIEPLTTRIDIAAVILASVVDQRALSSLVDHVGPAARRDEVREGGS